MGNTKSLPHQLPLLSPRPSNKSIHLAIHNDPDDNTFIPASQIIHLLILDTQTNTTTPYYIKRCIKLSSVLNFVAKQQGYSAEELEMRIHETVIGGNATADMLGLKDGTTLSISRKPAEEIERERVSEYVDRNGSERVEDEARMRSLLAQRFERKCRIARDAFGDEWAGGEKEASEASLRLTSRAGVRNSEYGR